MATTRGAVLVVDDDQMNRLLLSRLLEHEGYEAREAADGAQALAALEEARVEAVLLDIVMPGMDGMQVLQLIKANREVWGVPVIMISSVEDTDSIARCIELGAEDYLPKPFDPLLLKARLNAALARKRFHDLEVQYRRQVSDQAAELEQLNRQLIGRLEELERPALSGPGVDPTPVRPHRRRATVSTRGPVERAIRDRPTSVGTGVDRTLPVLHDWNGESGRPALRPFTIDDETLRDGLQSPSVSDPPIGAKVELLHQMVGLGIGAADIGLPAASSRAADSVRALAREVMGQRLPLQPNCAARTVIGDVAAVADIADETGCPLEVMAFIGSSPLRMYAEGWTVQDLVHHVSEAISFGVQRGLSMCLVTEDTTRSDPDVVKLLYGVGLECGATRVCVCDTAGHATPEGAARLIRFVRSEVIEAGGYEGVQLDWHGHNDRGLAVANTLAALEAGADRVHATALGIGERSGNTNMEQLLVNLQLRGWYRANLAGLPDYTATVSDGCRFVIPPNHPIVGADAFRTGTGVHAAAILKAAQRSELQLMDAVYSAVPASVLGLSQEIEIGPMSGASNVVWWLLARRLPITSLIVEAVLGVAKQSSRVLTEAEITSVVQPLVDGDHGYQPVVEGQEMAGAAT